MAKSYVLLVHGVGKQPAGSWWKLWELTLFDALRSYAPYLGRSDQELAEDFRFWPCSYDDISDIYAKNWQDLAKAIHHADVVANPGMAAALAWVAGQDSSLQKVFYDDVLDVILWYGIPQARAAMQARVAEAIVKGFAAAARDGADVHLISHSLGTSVAHDAIVGLVAANLLSPARKRLSSVSALANTGRLLQAWADVDAHTDLTRYAPYTSVLRPGPRGMTSHYANFHHQIDPITWPLRFAPPDWAHDSYSDVMTVNFANPAHVHDADHYLANPQVHLPILRMITGDQNLGAESEVKAAWAAFSAKFPNTTSRLFQELKSLFHDDSDRRLSIPELTKYLTLAFRVLR